jgi:hypothetical protein
LISKNVLTASENFPTTSEKFQRFQHFRSAIFEILATSENFTNLPDDFQAFRLNLRDAHGILES